jgi:hypothetical protein
MLFCKLYKVRYVLFLYLVSFYYSFSVKLFFCKKVKKEGKCLELIKIDVHLRTKNR